MSIDTGEAVRPAANATVSLVHAYQPVLQGYFKVATVYYAAMIFAHALTQKGNDLVIMVAASAVGCLGCASALFALRVARSAAAIELATTLVNLLVIGNVMAGLQVEFGQAKLVYFIMMIMIFAFACASIRQALVSILITFACLFYELSHNAPEQLKTFGFVGFAAALAAIGITCFLRRTLAVALAERTEAEADRRNAEGRLESARRMSEQMRQQSLTDSLTGLPNRRAFFEQLELRRSQGSFWLVLLDLDGFKSVNDNYGHMIGDELLRAVAQRLIAACGTSVDVSRIGGDEFNIIVLECLTRTEIAKWCENLLSVISKVYEIEGRQILISASIGCCRSDAGDSEIGLIQMADYALLHAKRSGRNRATIFRDEHARDATARFRIEQALRIADLERELCLVFQPQFDLRSRRITAAEALVRWNSPTLGPVNPGEFVLIAEECGLIAGITLTVLDKVLQTLRTTSARIPIGMNLSGHDLLSDDVIGMIISRVDDSGVDPSLLEFEITETAMMPDIERATANVARLAEHGHAIALDDFGTGYSNLRYLRALPINKLKVDRAFMDNAGDVMTEKLLRSVAGMARTLGVQCLFEGVEGELEMLLAQRAGAQAVQGYLIGKPMPWEKLTAMVADDEDSTFGQRVTFQRAR